MQIHFDDSLLDSYDYVLTLSRAQLKRELALCNKIPLLDNTSKEHRAMIVRELNRRNHYVVL